jgi:hypothetical protein
MGRIENKEKLQVNSPSLNSTRSSSFDLVFDEVFVHFAQWMIPAQNHKEEQIMPSGKATWQVKKRMEIEDNIKSAELILSKAKFTGSGSHRHTSSTHIRCACSTPRHCLCMWHNTHTQHQ